MLRWAVFGEASEKGPAGLGDSAGRAHERTNASVYCEMSASKRMVVVVLAAEEAIGWMVCVRAAELCPNNDFVPLGRLAAI